MLALTALAAASAGPALGAADREPAASGYELVPLDGAPPSGLDLAPSPPLDGFTVEAVRSMLPERYTGTSARLVPVDSLYFLPASNILEMDRVWKASGVARPTCIVIARGSYSLESILEQVGSSGAITRDGERSYLLSRPIYIAPTGTLVVSAGESLRLSSADGTFVFSNGSLIVVDSEVIAWDAAAREPSRREALEPETVLLYARQRPRPYLLASEGSRTFIAGSTIRGLGYKGTSGTFGVSMSPSVGRGRLGRYLERLARPTGWLVGNRIIGLFFGFYSNEAEDVAIVGNLFSRNVVYGVDPHDYSKRLIVARNVAQGSTFAHGIIFSRGVRDSWVVENIAVANGGSGIMMDRASTDNLIARNLVVGNDGDGIAIFESDRNSLRGNTVSRNARSAILVRNSADVEIFENRLSMNGRSGVELSVADISDLETRDFTLDPFTERASATVRRNRFERNLQSAVVMKGADAVTLHANSYAGSGPLYFDGDLKPFAGTLVAAELGRQAPIVVRRIDRAGDDGDGARGSGRRAASARRPSPVLEEHASRGVPRAMLALARHFSSDAPHASASRRAIYWYARAIHHGRVSALSELGVALLGGLARSDGERREGLVLLTMAALLGHPGAEADLHLLPDLLGVDRSELERARAQAARRVSMRELWSEAAFADVRVRLSREEAAQAERRREALWQQRPAHEPSDPPRLDGARRARYRARVDAKNARLDERNRRLRQGRLADARATGERRAYLDRVDARERAARLRVRAYTDEQRRAQLEAIAHVLERVNRHRAVGDALALDEIDLPARAAPDR